MTPLKFAVLPMLLALSLCQTTAAAVSSASFQATFVISEACTIRSHRAQAQVQCQHGTPYQLLPGQSPAGADMLTVNF